MIRSVQYGVGIAFILLGIAGLFLPFLQGVILIVLGIFVLKLDKTEDVWKSLRSAISRHGRKKRG